LKDHYQVKFQRDGKTIYGVADTCDIELARKGQLLVADAILPKTYLVPESAVTDVPMEPFPDEMHKFVEAELEKAQAASDALTGLVPGKLFALGVGDGHAWYVVTKVSKTRCAIEWRGFCIDRYTDHILGWGGSFQRSIIERLVRLKHLARWSLLTLASPKILRIPSARLLDEGRQIIRHGINHRITLGELRRAIKKLAKQPDSKPVLVLLTVPDEGGKIRDRKKDGSAFALNDCVGVKNYTDYVALWRSA